MTELFTVSSLAALVTLSLLEIVLGIDNLVVISILSDKLPESQRARARRIGLTLAAVGRVALLLAIAWVITLESVILFELPFALGGHATEGGANVTPFSIKDLILIVGGMFLVAKATREVHHSLEESDATGPKRAHATMTSIVAQIFAMDLVFSIDSVLTAVGMVRPDDYSAFWIPLTIMIVAILLAVGVMVIFANPVGEFIGRHPTVKMLALSFMLMIGVVLVAEALHQHIPRGYIYSAIGFSLCVEILNLYAKRKRLARAAAA